jgi:Tfp pilus assembly protein PilO
MLKNLSLSNFNLKKLRQRDITIIISVVTLLLGLLWWFYMFQPSKARVAELETQITALNGEIDVGETAKRNLPQLEEQLAQAQADKAEFLRQLPRASEVSSLIETLRQTASSQGVTISSLNQGATTDGVIQDIRSIDFTLATSANYLPTMEFLDTLEGLKRFTKVRQVGFSKTDEGVDNPILDANFDFSVYVYTGGETVAETATESSGETQ